MESSFGLGRRLSSGLITHERIVFLLMSRHDCGKRVYWLENAFRFNGEMEGRSIAFPALGPYLPAHKFNQPSASCQPQTYPLIFARQRIIHLTEGFEETIPPIDGNAETGILDLEMNQIIGVRRNMNRNPAPLSELYGIFQQILEDLPEPFRIADNDCGMFSSMLQARIKPFADAAEENIENADSMQLYRLKGEVSKPNLSCFNHRKVEYIFYKG